MAIKNKVKPLGQSGMVSIIVTMILIIVMTLVVLAMSRNAITEQRQALDRQLSDQAFYNAESGIGDWANYLYKNPTLANQKSSCSNAGFAGAPSSQIGSDSNNTYTCLLYDKAPSSIIFSNLDPSDAKTIPITPNINLRRLVFTWSSVDTQTITTGCNLTSTGLLPTALPNNCNLSALKADLIDPGSINRANLSNNTFTGYFLPGSGPANSTVALSSGRTTAGQGLIGIPNCTNNVGCSITVDINSFGGVGLPANNTLFLHLKTLYLPGNVVITGFDNLNNPVRFLNAQILIDATGKANDVLRRVQVRVSAQSQYEQTDYALRSVEAICKLITVNKDNTPAPTATLDPRCQ